MTAPDPFAVLTQLEREWSAAQQGSQRDPALAQEVDDWLYACLIKAGVAPDEARGLIEDARHRLNNPEQP